MEPVDRVRVYPTPNQLISIRQLQNDCTTIFNMFLQIELDFCEQHKCWRGYKSDTEALSKLLNSPENTSITSPYSCLYPVIKLLHEQLKNHHTFTVTPKNSPMEKIRFYNVDLKNVKPSSFTLPGIPSSLTAKIVSKLKRFDMITLECGQDDKWEVTTGWDPATSNTVKYFKSKADKKNARPANKKLAGRKNSSKKKI